MRPWGTVDVAVPVLEMEAESKAKNNTCCLERQPNVWGTFVLKVKRWKDSYLYYYVYSTDIPKMEDFHGVLLRDRGVSNNIFVSVEN